MAPGDMLIFAAGHPPIYGKQLFYFLDPTFRARTDLKTPVASDRPRGTQIAESAEAASALKA